MANPPANPNQTPPAEPIDETPTPPNPHPIGTPEYEGFAKALAEIQQRRTEPAPPTSDDHRLAQAFVWAITSYVFLDRGEPDRMLRLGGKELSIGEIAAAASQLDGSMPDDVYALLSNAATPNFRQRFLDLRTLAGKTFSAGGQCLRAMYDASVKR